MTVKTTSQGVLHSQIWSLSGGLWPGDGSSKKVRGASYALPAGGTSLNCLESLAW